MAILCRLPDNDDILKAVENLLIMLCWSYYEKVTKEQSGEPDIVAWAVNSINAALLTGIARPVFQQTNWVPACPRLNLQGINITSPFNEVDSREQSVWVRQDGPGYVTFRRSDSRITKYTRNEMMINCGGARKKMAWLLNVPCKKINKHGYNLEDGSIVSVVVEIATDGRVHKRQYGRLPLVGRFSDWQQCLGFAVRIEWMTSTGLKCHYVQRHIDRFEHGNIPSSYLETSSLVAAFKGNAYNCTTDWRKHFTYTPFRVVKISFDNLSRTLKVEQLVSFPNVQEPTLVSTAQIGDILRSKGLIVSKGKPANFRQQTNSTQRFRCDSCIAVRLSLYHQVLDVC